MPRSLEMSVKVQGKEWEWKGRGGKGCKCCPTHCKKFVWSPLPKVCLGDVARGLGQGVEKTVVSKMLEQGTNRSTYPVDRHAGVVSELPETMSLQ